MYKQVKPFNQSTAGHVIGLCLQNVRKGYGIAAEYANAITAWNRTVQHKDRSIPAGVDTPLFYSYGKAGHVNVHLADGRIWSDGKLYSSLSTYESLHQSVHYLGWGETLNDVRVIQYVADHIETVKPVMWNVRSTNSLSGSILGQVHGGERYNTVVVGDSWRKITFNGKTGYVSPKAW